MTSVDISDSMLECARKNASDNGSNIDFRKGDAMNLDYPDSVFDAVVSDYMLWSRSARRPNDDLTMSRKAGFKDITVINGVQKKVLHGMRYYAYGYTNNHFTIAARK